MTLLRLRGLRNSSATLATLKFSIDFDTDIDVRAGVCDVDYRGGKGANAVRPAAQREPEETREIIYVWGERRRCQELDLQMLLRNRQAHFLATTLSMSRRYGNQ